MTFYGFIFYLLAVVTVGATVVAITRRNLVHAVVYLIFSYFGTAMLFYLFGAPLLAALEVIIYAGAIMVLFLFVVMMIKVDVSDEIMFPLSQWVPAGGFGLAYIVVAFMIIGATPGSEASLGMLVATPREFALYVFKEHWFLIEVISLLLLVALIGALRVGRTKSVRRRQVEGEV